MRYGEMDEQNWKVHNKGDEQPVYEDEQVRHEKNSNNLEDVFANNQKVDSSLDKCYKEVHEEPNMDDIGTQKVGDEMLGENINRLGMYP